MGKEKKTKRYVSVSAPQRSIVRETVKMMKERKINYEVVGILSLTLSVICFVLLTTLW